MFFVCFFFPVKVHMPFIHSISKLYFFSLSGKKNAAFSFIQSIFPQNVKNMNFYSKKKNTIPLLPRYQNVSSRWYKTLTIPLMCAIIQSLVCSSFIIISFGNRMLGKIFSNNRVEASSEQGNEVYQNAVVVSPGNNSTNCGRLHLQRGTSLNILHDGYGKAEKSGESIRIMPYHGKDGSNQTLADVLGSSMEYLQFKDSTKCRGHTKSLSAVSTEAKGRDALHAMLKIGSNRTESEQAIEDVLKRRANIYGDNLDPTWFRLNIDLGLKATSIEDRSKARAMLAAAPLMLAQEGALEFRKRMLEGDASVLSTLRVEESTTFSQVLKKLEKVPPLAILKLCNKELGDFVINSLQQQSEDLDYVQEVLDAASESALSPTKHAVLAGFRQRRSYGSFKKNGESVAMERLKFLHLASPKDQYAGSTMRKDPRSTSKRLKGLCQYFQRIVGCKYGDLCNFEHYCVICDSKSHGAFYCRNRGQRFVPPKDRDMCKSKDKNKRSRSVPHHPRRSRIR